MAFGLGEVLGAAANGILNSQISSAQGMSKAENWSNSSGGSVSGSSAMSMTDATSANENAAYQAAVNRNWQEYMSNTAYQRAVRDMKAAGLNPVLAVYNGGASTPTGATAQGFMDSMSASSSGSSSWEDSRSYGYQNSENSNYDSRGFMNAGEAIEKGTIGLTSAAFNMGLDLATAVENSSKKYHEKANEWFGW